MESHLCLLYFDILLFSQDRYLISEDYDEYYDNGDTIKDIDIMDKILLNFKVECGSYILIRRNIRTMALRISFVLAL